MKFSFDICVKINEKFRIYSWVIFATLSMYVLGFCLIVRSVCIDLKLVVFGSWSLVLYLELGETNQQFSLLYIKLCSLNIFAMLAIFVFGFLGICAFPAIRFRYLEKPGGMYYLYSCLMATIKIDCVKLVLYFMLAFCHVHGDEFSKKLGLSL